MPESFFQAYVTCALWSSTDNSRDDGGDPLDDNYDASDIDADSLAAMRKDCEAFYAECSAEIAAGQAKPGRWSDDEIAGHDFWLTRNGHVAGFWDGDWPEPAATRLTKASKAYGSCDLLVGDDGRIYAS